MLLYLDRRLAVREAKATPLPLSDNIYTRGVLMPLPTTR